MFDWPVPSLTPSEIRLFCVDYSLMPVTQIGNRLHSVLFYHQCTSWLSLHDCPIMQSPECLQFSGSLCLGLGQTVVMSPRLTLPWRRAASCTRCMVQDANLQEQRVSPLLGGNLDSHSHPVTWPHQPASHACTGMSSHVGTRTDNQVGCQSKQLTNFKCTKP